LTAISFSVKINLKRNGINEEMRNIYREIAAETNLETGIQITAKQEGAKVFKKAEVSTVQRQLWIVTLNSVSPGRSGKGLRREAIRMMMLEQLTSSQLTFGDI